MDKFIINWMAMATLFVLLRLWQWIMEESEKNKDLNQIHNSTIPMPIDYQILSEGGSVMWFCLREVRERIGMTQSDLAKASDVSQSHISEIESGKAIPTVFVAKKLAAALGVSVDELIQEKK